MTTKIPAWAARRNRRAWICRRWATSSLRQGGRKVSSTPGRCPLTGLTKQVLEITLDVELSEHWGHEQGQGPGPAPA
jgi:hypothetical protein